ncbi:flagellar hook-length control protein FliK [Cognatishimia sp.]|uniref:flagellar hook-length control protein FliK n=1 Tax=Cognatishimia sp. TaxID=2211648 RepID=UPI0035110902
MNIAVNPLVALLGGGAAHLGGAQSQPGTMNFAQLLKGQGGNALLGQQPEMLARLIGKAEAVLATVESLTLDTQGELEGFTLEGLADLLTGEVSLSPETAEGELASLMQTLSDIQDLMRDILDVLPDLMAQFAPEDLGLELQDGQTNVSVATILEVTVFVRDIVSQQSVMPQRTMVSRLNSAHLQGVHSIETRPTPALSLISEIDGIALPDVQAKETLTLTPVASAVVRTLATAAIQTQKSAAQAIDFEASETPLALTSRTEPAQFDQIEQPQAPQPRPENQISTKFANVLVNQVRQVDIQEGTTRIELSPRGLGSIEVEMRTNSDGSLAIVVRAENDAVLSALREERDLLAAIIGDSANGSLDFQEYSEGQNREQGDLNGSNGQGADAEDETVEANASASAIVNGPELDLVT